MSASREISPFLQKMRALFLGRVIKHPLRFQPEVASRPGPEANLPEGPSHRLATNYYFTRDARREVERPNELADNSATKAIEAGGKEAKETETAKIQLPKVGKTPGAFYNYSQQ